MDSSLSSRFAEDLVFFLVFLTTVNGSVEISKTYYHGWINGELQQNQTYSKNITNSLDCAVECMDSGLQCFGFKFVKENKSCDMMACVNLELIEKIATSESDALFYFGHQLVSHLLARDKPAEMSSLFDDMDKFSARKANDGIYLPLDLGSDEHISLAATKSSTNPYWRVNLQELHCIWAVRILNRAQHQTGSAWLEAEEAMVRVSVDEVGLSDEASICAFYPGILERYYTLINCTSAMVGQFVQIQFIATVTLQLYEVEVHGV